MDFIELNLLSGNTLSVQKSVIVAVMDLKYMPKELLKEKPFLKEHKSCTYIQLSVSPEELYCRDSYSEVMQKLQ